MKKKNPTHKTPGLHESVNNNKIVPKYMTYAALL